MAWPLGSSARIYTWPFIFPGRKLDQFVKVLLPPFKLENSSSAIRSVRSAPSDTTIGVGAYSEGAPMGFVEPGLSVEDTNFTRIGTTVNLDILTRLANNEPGDVMEKAVVFARAHLIKTLGEYAIEGGPSFNGLTQKISPGQTIGASDGAVNGGPVTLDDIRKLVHMVTAMDEETGTGPDALVMAAKTVRAIEKLMQSAGQSPRYGYSERVGKPVLLGPGGLPCYVGQASEIESKGTGTNLTSIWALKLAGSSAVRLLSGAGGDEDGIVLTEGGPAFTGGNYPVNIVWVHGFYALFVPIEEAIARLDGIDNSLVI